MNQASAEGDEVSWTEQPQIVRNLLESCANWLESRSHCQMLRIQPDPEEGGGYASLMREYAKNLRELNAVLTVKPQPKGIDPWQILSEIDTWACTLPTFEVVHEGGPDAATKNVVLAIKKAAAALAQAPAPAPEGYKLVGYYHKAESGNSLEDDFFFADAINGDCPACHPCYIDASVTVSPTPVQWRVPEGWKLVPVNPTPEILQAIFANERDARAAWMAALDFAPAVPSPAVKAEPASWCDLRPPMLLLGRTYKTASGKEVRMVSISNAGTEYESMADEDGHHRYSRSHSRIVGRCTGSPDDDPLNIPFNPPVQPTGGEA